LFRWKKKKVISPKTLRPYLITGIRSPYNLHTKKCRIYIMYIDIDYDNQLYNNIFHKIFRTMSVSHLGSSWSYGGWIYYYLCNKCLSPLTYNVVSLNPTHGEVYSIQHYVIKFVSDLQQVGGFLWVIIHGLYMYIWSLLWTLLAIANFLAS
jgi:hypothetical protein